MSLLCIGFQKAQEVDSKLMLPVFDILCPFLPEKIRTKLRLGVQYRRDSFQVTRDQLSIFYRSFHVIHTI